MHTVRRYANRKFYHVQGHRYIGLEEIAALVRSGEPVCILDHPTGREITAEVLAQIVARGLATHEGAVLDALASALRALIRLSRLPLEEGVRVAAAAAGLPTRADWERLEQRLCHLEAAVERLFDAQKRDVL